MAAAVKRECAAAIELRACRECFRRQEPSRYPRAGGRVCLECVAFRKYKSRRRRLGLPALDKEAWVARYRGELPEKPAVCCRCGSNEHLMMSRRAARAGRKAHVVYRCALCRRDDRRRAAELKGKMYIPGGLAAFWEWRRANRPKAQPRPQSPARAARAAWISWLERAPEWWRAAYAETRRQTINAKYREYHRLNAEKVRAKVKAYKHSHPTRRTQWDAKRIQRVATLTDGSVTQSAVKGVLSSRSRCPYCLATLNEHTGRSLDHVIPIKLGGWHSVRNLTVCCRACNAAKSALPFDRWVARLSASGRKSAIAMYRKLYGCDPTQSALPLVFTPVAESGSSWAGKN